MRLTAYKPSSSYPRVDRLQRAEKLLFGNTRFPKPPQPEEQDDFLALAKLWGKRLLAIPLVGAAAVIILGNVLKREDQKPLPLTLVPATSNLVSEVPYGNDTWLTHHTNGTSQGAFTRERINSTGYLEKIPGIEGYQLRTVDTLNWTVSTYQIQPNHGKWPKAFTPEIHKALQQGKSLEVDFIKTEKGPNIQHIWRP